MNSTGYIIDGVYHKEKPHIDSMKNRRAVTDKQYGHDRQRENHRKDLLQPYDKGRPNPRFIEQYPKEARDYGFTKEKE